MLEVLGTRQPLVDRGILPGQSDARPRPTGIADDVDAVDERTPGVGLQQRRQDANCRRLAGAVRAEQPEHARARNREIDAPQRLGLTEPLRKSDGGHGRFVLVGAWHWHACCRGHRSGIGGVARPLQFGLLVHAEDDAAPRGRQLGFAVGDRGASWREPHESRQPVPRRRGLQRSTLVVEVVFRSLGVHEHGVSRRGFTR